MTGTGIQRIASPNGCFYRSNEYGENGTTEYNGMEFGETTTYDKTAGTAQDTAFCVVTIDLDESMVYADHYGAGYDRAVSFDGTVSTSYSVTYSLTNVTSSSSVSEVASGEPYSTTLNPKSGYELSKVTVTMGGVDITSSSYLASKVTIGSVTDSVMITAVAVEPGTDEPDVPYHNLVSSSLASGGGSVYNVTGYKDGYRLNSSGAEAELANATITGFIPYNGEVVRVYGSTRDGSESGQYLVAYDSNFKHIYSLAPTNSSAAGLSYQKVNGKYLLTYDVSKETTSTIKSNFESAAYIRASCAGCKGADLIVTLDEPIE